MSGPVLVLVHGASGSAASWALGPWGERRVVAVDLPGRGRSSGPPLSHVEDLARWLVGELARLGERPVILGHSLGGAVALQLILDHPGVASGIVMVSSSARLKVSPAILAAVGAATDDAPFRLDLGFGATTPPGVIEAYARAVASVPAATSVADWRACDGFDVRDRVGEATPPVLVVHGSDDRLTPPKHQAWLADQLPAGERIEVPGAAHMLPWERPEELTELVEGWLEGHTGG